MNEWCFFVSLILLWITSTSIKLHIDRTIQVVLNRLDILEETIKKYGIEKVREYNPYDDDFYE